MISSIEGACPSFERYQGRSYFLELDGIRGISVLMVISFHVRNGIWGWLSGELGVQIFFVLSGYLITMLALREERSSGSMNLAAFYVRRFFRLFPLYYFCLALYCVLIFGLGLTPQKRPQLIWALPYYLTYFQEWPFFYGMHEGKQTFPFGHTWTLGIEEKFYLFWPVLVFVVMRGAERFRLAATVLLAILTISTPLVSAKLGQLVQPYTHILIGCATAFVLENPVTFRRVAWLGRTLLPALLVVSLLGLQVSMIRFSYDWNHALRFVYSLGVAIVLIAILLENGRIQRTLQSPALVAIGRLSYGMYLIQFLVLTLSDKVLPDNPRSLPASILSLLFVCALTILGAQILAVTIERPGREIGRRFSQILQAVGHRRPELPASVAVNGEPGA